MKEELGKSPLFLSQFSSLNVPKEKEDGSAISRLSYDEKIRVRVLSFYSNRPNYYKPYVLNDYIRNLPYLRFVYIRAGNDFVANPMVRSDAQNAIIVRAISHGLDQYDQVLKLNDDLWPILIQDLDSGDVFEKYISRYETSSTFFNANTSLEEALNSLRQQNIPFAGVIDVNGKFLGVVEKYDLEQYKLDSEI